MPIEFEDETLRVVSDATLDDRYATLTNQIWGVGGITLNFGIMDRVIAGQTQGHFHTRIHLAPAIAKLFCQDLITALRDYEGRYGFIPDGRPPRGGEMDYTQWSIPDAAAHLLREGGNYPLHARTITDMVIRRGGARVPVLVITTALTTDPRFEQVRTQTFRLVDTPSPPSVPQE